MIAVNPNFGNGAFAAIEIFSLQTPGKAGAMSADFCNLHDPPTTLNVRRPFEGLRSSLPKGVLVLDSSVEVEIHAPDSGMAVAEKVVLKIELLTPLAMVTA